MKDIVLSSGRILTLSGQRFPCVCVVADGVMLKLMWLQRQEALATSIIDFQRQAAMSTYLSPYCCWLFKLAACTYLHSCFSSPSSCYNLECSLQRVMPARCNGRHDTYKPAPSPLCQMVAQSLVERGGWGGGGGGGGGGGRGHACALWDTWPMVCVMEHLYNGSSLTVLNIFAQA